MKEETQEHNELFLHEAINLATNNVKQGGGPFGAVIVKDGKVIATGTNRVTIANDPTAHAEVEVIRKAASALGTFDLSGCVLYASCEPCPMCLGAIYWARIDRVIYAAERGDAKAAGFDDALIYDEIALQPGERSISMVRMLPGIAGRPFDAWRSNDKKIAY